MMRTKLVSLFNLRESGSIAGGSARAQSTKIRPLSSPAIRFEVDKLDMTADSPTNSYINLGEHVPDEENKEADPDQDAFLWHEVTIKPFVDPDSHKELVIIEQVDVTAHLARLSSDMTDKYGTLSEKQITFLSSFFPLHILQHLMKSTDVEDTSGLLDTSMSENLI